MYGMLNLIRAAAYRDLSHYVTPFCDIKISNNSISSTLCVCVVYACARAKYTIEIN